MLRALVKLQRKAIKLGNGQVDILINNAGVFPFAPTPETSEEMFDQVYALNVKVPFTASAKMPPLWPFQALGGTRLLPAAIVRLVYSGTLTTCAALPVPTV